LFTAARRGVVQANARITSSDTRAIFQLQSSRQKPEYEEATTGLQQAKDYAEILKFKFAYATNGKTIIEFDYITGLECEIPRSQHLTNSGRACAERKS